MGDPPSARQNVASSLFTAVCSRGGEGKPVEGTVVGREGAKRTSEKFTCRKGEGETLKNRPRSISSLLPRDEEEPY